MALAPCIPATNNSDFSSAMNDELGAHSTHSAYSLRSAGSKHRRSKRRSHTRSSKQSPSAAAAAAVPKQVQFQQEGQPPRIIDIPLVEEQDRDAVWYSVRSATIPTADVGNRFI